MLRKLFLSAKIMKKAAIKTLIVRYKTCQSRILMKLLTDSIRKNTTIDINIFGKSIFTAL